MKTIFKVAVVGVAIWAFCQIDMAGAIFKMMWFPALCTIIALRLMHNKFFATDAEKAATVASAQRVVNGMQAFNARHGGMKHEHTQKEEEWGSFTGTMATPYSATIGEVFKTGLSDED